MGCTASKSLEMQARMDGWSPPISKSFVRSFSMPLKLLQQSPSRTRDSAGGVEDLHIVALTSSTYGALTIPDEDDTPQEQQQQEEDKEQLQEFEAPVVKESAKLSDAKSLPSVPEAEVIDLWELMKDLNDVEQQQPRTITRKRKGSGARVLSRCISSVDSMRELDVKIRSVALALPNLEKKLRALDALNSISLSGEQQQQQDGRGFHLRSSRKSIEISSNFSANCRSLECSPARSKQQLQSAKSLKGLFYGATLDSESEHPSKRLNTSSSASSYCSSSSYDASSSGDSEESSSSSLFDSEILKTFQQQSDASPHSSCEQLDCKFDKRLVSSSRKMLSSKVAAIEVEEQRMRVWDSFPEICPPKGDDRAVLYVTSLRGIRKTFEDCSRARMILEGFGIAIDERDVSMHAEFRQELKELLSQLRTTSEEKPALAVPRLFIRGRYVGGVEEVGQLNEEGVIAKLVDGIPRQHSKEVCDGCGGARFVPCFECSGSCKLVKFGGGVGNFSGSGVVVRCSDCNENGLIRCPVCF